MSRKTSPRLFISYSHDSREHEDRVRALADRLRQDGIDAVIDQYNPAPAEGWPMWMDREIQKADFVALVCTETYLKRVDGRETPGKGRGVLWEGQLIYNLLYGEDTSHHRLIPVFFERGTLSLVPPPIRGLRYYQIDVEEDYEDFCRHLISWPKRQSIPPPKLKVPVEPVDRSSEIGSAPTSPQLALTQMVALQLSIQQPSGEYRAMASLVLPNLAITSYHILAPSGLSRDPKQTITVRALDNSVDFVTSVKVVVADESANVALLELDGYADVDLPDNLLSLETIAPTGKCYSCCLHAEKGPLYLDGLAEGPFALKSHEYQVLQLSTPVPNAGEVSGAPVIWNEQLIGIVALSNAEGSSWYVTPISQRVVQSLASRSGSTPRRPKERLSKSDIERFSAQARDIISRADQLRQERNLKMVHMRDLLRSLAQQASGQFSILLKAARVDMEALFRRQASAAEARTLETSIDFAGLPPISPNVRRALILARNQANQTGSRTIDDSHILFGALSVSEYGVVQNLQQRGITPDIVGFGPTTLSATKSGFLAGIQSDLPSGDDLLDITKEVNALASVLAAKEVGPPLALGLFGEWGSGKSFFMGRLEDRIRILQEDAQEARNAGIESSYCEHIVQFTFNAWNYIDTDLWASLAAKIFENLAAALAKRRGGDSQEERALVLAAASSSEAVLAEAERKKSAAEQELEQTQQELAVLQSRESSIEAGLSARELFKQAYRFAIAQDEVKTPLENAAKLLRVREGAGTTGNIKSQILELHGIWQTLIFTLRYGRDFWIWLMIFIAMLGMGLVVTSLLKRYHVIQDTANHVVTILAAVSGFLATFRIWAQKALNFVELAKKSKQELIERREIEKSEALRIQYRVVQEKVKKATEAVGTASEKVDHLTKQLENMRADRQMADFIRQRNESSDYTKHLGIIARVRTDFQHLSTLLRDVKKESEEEVLEMKSRQAQKEQQRKAAKQKECEEEKAKHLATGNKKEPTGQAPNTQMEKDDKLFPRIDRIILYIDDLDRCPEKNVVEVLQAVHLLLAFPLFIVVVGVDPRWLLRSLERRSAVLSQIGEDSYGPTSKEEDSLWQSTPMNYLEKIFQIPFTLRPINRAGFSNLVEKFAASPKKDSGRAETTIPKLVPTLSDAKARDMAVAVSGETSASPGAPVRGEPTLDSQQPGASGTEADKKATQALPATKNTATNQSATGEPVRSNIDRNPEHLHIEEWERTFMKTLSELIPSPRAAKRFINIYRLLRASVEDSEHARFVGDAHAGEYHAVQLLLALLIGYPAEATEILQELMKEKQAGTWGDFIASLKKRVDTSTTEQRQSTQIPKQRPSSAPATLGIVVNFDPRQTQRWLELFDKLESIKKNLNDRPTADFEKWALRVARYSFQSGRVLLHQRD